MPRLHPSLLRKARAIDRLLPSLLPVCRDLSSARNELGWLKEYAINTSQGGSLHHNDRLLANYVKRRARGEPLQYILGSEYFGDLEIRCRPGVLIPRPETAASVTYFARLLSQGTAEYCAERDLRVLDLCTGSGCIPLLFHYEFYSRRSNRDQRLDLVGIDVSPKALQLAKENLLSIQLSAQASEDEKSSSRLQSLTTLRFLHADVLSSQDDAQNTDGQPRGVIDALRRFHQSESPPTCDILISNPPYISSKAFRTTTARSVRHFEPKLALVPPNRSISGTSTHNGDVFYPRLLELAERLQTQVVLFEVADLDQAKRVASMGFGQGIWTGVEIWRDEPGAQVARPEEVVIDGKVVKVRGVGNGRSVFAYRGDGAEWLNRSCSQ